MLYMLLDVAPVATLSAPDRIPRSNLVLAVLKILSVGRVHWTHIVKGAPVALSADVDHRGFGRSCILVNVHPDSQIRAL